MLGNDPGPYREAFAAVITALYPQSEVLAVDPSDVEAVLHLRRPCLLICSHLTRAIEAAGVDWVLIPAVAGEAVVIDRGGVRESRAEFGLPDLLSIVDRVLTGAVGAVPLQEPLG